MLATEVLAEQTAERHDELRRICEGLTDAEFFWEPVPGSWTVFQENGRWTYDYDSRIRSPRR